MIKIWKSIPGYGGYFEASSAGDVRSLPRVDSLGRRHDGKILAQHRHGKSYLGVHLSVCGVKCSRLVHHLVLMAFVGPRPPGMEARHLDGNGRNNCSRNLSWSNHTDNEADKRTHGTLVCGLKYPGAKLTPSKVRRILKRLNLGDFQKDIARSFGVTQTAISKIKRGVLWRTVSAS